MENSEIKQISEYTSEEKIKHVVSKLKNYTEEVHALWNDHEEFMNKWMDALTSGDYKQGESLLCDYKPDLDDYVYCCLGVAASIGMPDKEPVDFDGDDFLYAVDHIIPKGYPKQLVGDVGLTSKLAGINDAHIDFKYIAEGLKRMKP